VNSRERFAQTMAHKQPDRVPMDIGGTSLTGMRPACQRQLRKLLGFADDGKLSNNGVDERILEWAGTDFRSVGGLANLPSVHSKRDLDTFTDIWGVKRQFIGGYWEIVHSPLKTATAADIKSYQWPEPRIDEKTLAKWERDAKALKHENKYVVVAEHPILGVMELGCWMCGYDQYLYNLAADLDFFKAFSDKVLDMQLTVIEQYYSVLGPYIDLTMNGDDFGTQTGPFMSPEMFEKLIAPYMKARISRIKELAHCYFWHHSCGSVFTLLDQLIQCGVDILNPVQTSAAQMEPERLKKHFGDRLVFWGAVDVQQFLPNATIAQVREEVLSLARTLGKDGGYVMAPAHEMQEDIPPEKIIAWVDAMHGR
jgi:uroporphyrinogen decarboxylase